MLVYKCESCHKILLPPPLFTFSEDLGIDLSFGGGLNNNGADLSEGTGLGLLAQKNSFIGAGAFNFGNNFRFRG